VCHPRCVCETRKRYVVKHNLITEVYLMTVMETTTCFGLYWPSSGCLGNLKASYMHARARCVLLPVSVMFHSVLSDPCFDSVCQTMRM